MNITPLRRWATLAGCGLALLTAGIVDAQTSVDTTAVAVQVDVAQARLRAVETAVAPRGLDDAALQARGAELIPADDAFDAAVAVLTPQLTALDAQLAELGLPPAAGQPPEATEISQQRAQVLHQREMVDAELKHAKLLTVELDQLTARIEDRRRALFSTRLWTPSRSIFSPFLWRDFAVALPGDLQRLSAAGAGELRALTASQARPVVAIEQLVALIAAILIIVPGRRLLAGLGQRRAAATVATVRLARSLLIAWLVVISVLTTLAAGYLLRSVLLETAALTAPFVRLTLLVLRVAVFAALVAGLGRALLAADHAERRLLSIPEALAVRLRPYPLLIAAVVAVGNLIAGLHSALGLSLAGSVASNCAMLVVALLVIARTLAVAGHGQLASPADATLATPSPLPLAQASGPSSASRGSQLSWTIAGLAAWLAVIAAAAAVLIGYQALAGFIVRELVWIAVVLAGLFVTVRLSDDLFPAVLGPESRFGRSIQLAVGVSEAALRQLGILLSGLAQMALLLFGWTLIVAPFGASASDVFGRITSNDLVIHIGQTVISPGTIVGGIVILFVGLLVTRSIRHWLEARYLPATALDIGVRASLATLVSYLGAILALVFACSFLGLSLDRIALFAGALSIGIGFGLQSVVSNFVSGLILMIERPVKVGDWIAIGDLEGDVRRVSVRAPAIEMKDRSRLIVPNLDLITKTVRNVTHAGSLGRIRIVLRVNDDADPLALRDLLIAHIAAHPKVLAEPAPAVYLTDARDGGLEFTSIAYVPSARDVYGVRSDLLFKIVPDLKANGFALANSTPIVNLGMDGRLIEPAAGGVPPS